MSKKTLISDLGPSDSPTTHDLEIKCNFYKEKIKELLGEDFVNELSFEELLSLFCKTFNHKIEITDTQKHKIGLGIYLEKPPKEYTFDGNKISWQIDCKVYLNDEQRKNFYEENFCLECDCSQWEKAIKKLKVNITTSRWILDNIRHIMDLLVDV